MSIEHPAAHLLRDNLGLMTVEKKVQKVAPTLDAVAEPANDTNYAGDYAEQAIVLNALTGLQEWVETEDLDEDETLSDRLMAIMVGVADADKDGEISEDEQNVLDIALNAVWDYMLEKGVSDEDADTLLNDWDAEAAERVRELLAANLPDGEDESIEEIDEFVFGDGASDSALDAVYKLKVAVRGGKKMRIRKRVSGTVRLNAKQKLSIRKAQRKAHSAAAQMRRMRSMKVRAKAGLNK